MATLSRRNVLRFAGAAAGMLLTGCGQVQTVQLAVSKATKELPEETTVSLLLPGQSDSAACDRVSRRLSKITLPTLGFSVQLEQLPVEKYEAQLWERLTRKKMPDIFFFSVSEANTSPAYRNMLYPMSELLAQHTALLAQFSKGQWGAQKQYRTVYAVPTSTTDCYRQFFLARSRVLESLNVRPETIRDMADLYQVLLQVRGAYPEMVPVVPDLGKTISCTGHDPLGNDLGVILGNTGTTVTNLYASPQYAELCSQMYYWYISGLILKNACFYNESAIDLMKAYDGFGFFTQMSYDRTEHYSKMLGEPLTAIPFGEVLQNSSGASNGWCISKESTHKQEAVALLELLYTDPAAAELFINGESDDDSADSSAGWLNMFADSACLYENEEETEYLQKVALTSDAYGFVFNASNCTALDGCRTIAKRYNDALLCGYLNPASALPKFLQELEEADVRSILEVKQNQLDAWLGALRR